MSDFNLKIILTANGETTTLDPTGTPASVELSGLTADTEYEVAVILQRDGYDIASDSETFRTLSDIDENTPFYLENLTENDASFTLTKTGTPTSTDLSYSLDNETWIEFDLTTATNTVEVPNGRIYLRSSTGFSKTNTNCFQLGMNQRFRVCGNIMNLLNYNNLDTELTSYCFVKMFYNTSNLIDASSLILPATTLANYCYQQMFYSCSNLTTAPELPATTLANNCYREMFYKCTSLTVTPELPATTLVSACYNGMFRGCTSITTAPELPATIVESNCYQSMFNGCTSLTTAPELPATTLANYCYGGMFYGCTSLTTAPKLPATTLVSSCYANMFYGCTNLITAPELPATTLVDDCYMQIFSDCSNLQSVTIYILDWNTSYTNNWLASAGTNVENPTIYCPADSTLKNYTGTSGIPTGWTQVDLPTE